MIFDILPTLPPSLIFPVLLAVVIVVHEICRSKLPYEVHPSLPKLPIVGAKEGEWFSKLRASWRNSIDIRSATQEAYRYKNEACLFPVADMGNVVILPPTERKWFHDQTESDLSAHIHQLNAFQLNYTITDPRLVEDTVPIHQILINTTLTRETNSLLPCLADEVMGSVDDMLGMDEKNFKEVTLMDEMPNVVGRIVNRAFIGPELCTDQKLIDAAVQFSRGLGFTSVLLRVIPQSLRLLAGPLMTLPQKLATWRFFSVLRPEVDRRLKELSAAGFENAEARSRINRTYNDFLQWTIEAAIQSGDRYMMKPETIMGRALLLNFVSIHTSSFAISHVLLDLAANSVDFTSELQKEIVAALEKHGGEWNKKTLNSMPKLDSTFRESQRMNSIVTVASPKPVCNPNGVTTPSGLHLPYGSYLAILSYPILQDPLIYPNPETFKPFRFAEAREAADQQGQKIEKARQGWVSVTKDFTAFGTGRHACPGRFFAAGLLKILLIYILLNYEIERLDERPKNPTFSAALFPPLTAKIKIRRRGKALYQFEKREISTKN